MNFLACVSWAVIFPAIAGAQDPVAMAEAMKLAVRAGRLACWAGPIPRKAYETASSSVEGLVGR